MNLLTGGFANTGTNPRYLQLHVGANVDQNVQIFIGTMTAQALGLSGLQGDVDSIISLATPESANMTIATIDSALKTVTKQRADLGAFQNRFETASRGIAIAAENLTASESRIRDTDMATEMVEFTKNQILTQSGVAMLAQANSNSQNVLSILR